MKRHYLILTSAFVLPAALTLSAHAQNAATAAAPTTATPAVTKPNTTPAVPPSVNTPAQQVIRKSDDAALTPVDAAAQVQQTERDETAAKAEGAAAGPTTEARATAAGLITPALPSPPAPDVQTTRRLGDARLTASSQSDEFTLEEAIILTLQNSPQRAATRAALAAAQARIGTARSAGGLQVGLSGGVNGSGTYIGSGSSSTTSNNNNNNGGVVVGGNNNNNNAVVSTSSGDRTSHSENIGISASLPVYTGGRVKAAKQVADFNARAAAANVLVTEQDLVLQATNGYLNILRSDQLLRVADSNLAVSRERQRVATVRYEAGASARLDVYRSNTVLADAQQRRIAAVNNASQARANLNSLMARLPESPLRIASIDRLALRVPLPLEVAEDARAGSPTGSLLELQTIAAQSRPQGEVARNDVFSSDAQVAAARAERRPSLGLSLSGILRNPASFLGRFAVGVGLSVAQGLFDSGRVSSQVREARALADQSRANFDLQLIGVANQIETAITSIDTAQGQQQSAEAAVGEAQAALAAAQLSYEAGAGTALDVTDAQTALLNVQTTAVNARFDFATAQAQLSAVTGVLTQEGQSAYAQALQQERSGTQSALSKQIDAENKGRRRLLGIPAPR